MSVTSRTDIIPDEIIVSRSRCEMRLVWPDGRDATLPASMLRAACRCAWCTRDRIVGCSSVEAHAVELNAVEALGSHGLHIKFSDGHARGVYPWIYLDQLARGAEPALPGGAAGTGRDRSGNEMSSR